MFVEFCVMVRWVPWHDVKLFEEIRFCGDDGRGEYDKISPELCCLHAAQDLRDDEH